MKKLIQNSLRLAIVLALAGTQIAWAQRGGRNNPPVADDDTATVVQGNTVVIPVLENDTDPDGDTLTVQNVRRAKGVVRIQDDGTLLYRPTPNFVGEDVFEYTINDGRRGRASARVVVLVTAAQANQDPVAYDATFDTQEEVAFRDTLPAFDADGDDLTYSIVNQGTKGTAVITDATTNEFTYTPDPDANDQDSFTFRVYDGAAYSNEAIVTITIEPVNDAPVITSAASTTATEDVPFSYTATATDVDGDVISFTFAGYPTWLSADGATLSGTPGEGDGDFAFTITADDNNGGSVILTVNVTVGPVNDVPVFTSSPVTAAAEGSAYTYNITVSDADEGAVLIIGAATLPAWLTLTDGGNGTAVLTGTPDNDDVGDHPVVLTLTDEVIATPVTQSFIITVSNVNDAPVAVDDIAGTPEDVAVIIEVLENDYDVDDGDLLTVQNVRQAKSKGKILIDRVNGTLLYTPSPNFSGTDVFYYTIHDVDGLTDEGMVTVTVGGVNDAPVAYDTTVTVVEDGSVSVTLRGFDAEGNALTFTVATYPAHGELTGDAPDLNYTPSENYYGEDTFTYTVSDGLAESNTATVTITVNQVNDAPVITSAASTTATEDIPFSYTATATDVDGDMVSFTFSGLPEWASASGATVSGTPGEGDGDFAFTITADDNNGGSDALPVSVTVKATNDAPVAESAIFTLPEDGSLEDQLSGSDPDGDAHTFALANSPAHGEASVSPSGAFTYTPDANYNGSDSFTFTVSDGALDSDTATVSISITPVPDAPVAVDDYASTTEETPIIIDVLENDIDVDGDEHLLQIVNVTRHNAEVHPRDDGKLDYQPHRNFSGTDVFNYTIIDPDGLKDDGMVTVVVSGVNDVPVFTSTPVTSATEGSAYTYNVTFDDDDVGAILSISATTLPGWLEFIDNGDGSTALLTGTPGNGDVGDHAVVLTLTDGIITTPVEQSFTITVSNVNDAPVFTSSPVSVAAEGSAYAYNITASDADEGAVLTINADTKPAWLDFTDNGDGTALLSGTPDNGDVGGHAVVLTLTDGIIATPVEQSFTITVSNVNDAPVFTSSPVSVAAEGSAYAYNITASDADEGAVLTINADTKPAWLDFTDNGDGTALLSGTPDNGDVGGHAVVLTLTDGIIATPVEQAFTITVGNVNDAPVALNDEAFTDENTPVSIDVLANDTDEDDGDVLSVASVTDPAHGTVQDNQDGTITYTPDTGFSGSDSFTYTATDGELVSDPATVTVLVNLAGDLAADEPVDPNEGGTVTTDIGVSIEIPGGSLSEAVNIQIGTYDEVPPGAPELAGILYFFGPSGTTFDPPATITVPYDPELLPQEFDPTDLVLLIYSEIDGTWEEALNSTVNTDAKTVSGQTTHFSGFAAGQLLARAPYSLGLPGVSINEDALSEIIISLADYFADPNFDDQIAFDATRLDKGLHRVLVIDDSLLVEPRPNFNGEVRIVITATDQTGLWVSDTLFLTVTPDNDPPFFLGTVAETYIIGEDSSLYIHLSADDVEGDNVTFDAASDTSAVVTVIVQDTTLLAVPIHNWHGTANIIVSASDGQDITYLDPFILTVESVNDPLSAFELLTPNIDAIIQVETSNLGDFLTFAWDAAVDPDIEDTVRYTFMLGDGDTVYFEYDTTVTEVSVSYSDIAAVISDLDLTSITFQWSIIAISGQDMVMASNGPYSLTIDISTLAVMDENHLPQFFALHQNYPNPFNPVTTLRYELPVYCQVLLVIYDMRGREVIRLVDGYESSGYNKVVWNSSDAFGRPVPSGIYFARLITPEYTHVIKMSLIR